MEISTDLVKLLMEIGYVAVGSGLSAEAAAIFAGVEAARPESELPAIGLAVSQMNSGRADEAVRTLRDKALVRKPDSQIAKSFLGLALKLAGFQADSRALLSEVVQANAHAEAVAMAQSLLAEPA